MGTPFPIPVSAAQVGTYFVGQYYQVLQQQPDCVHQFYSNESTVLHVDGSTRKTATAVLQIHSLVMSLNFTGIEVKTASSLESLNGGVLVMVSGSVQLMNFGGRRKFVQTFFLAPQEKGYFILNDIFQFIDEELIHHHPAVLLAQSNMESKLNASSPIPEQVSNYYGGDIQESEFVASVSGNGSLENYIYEEQQLQQAPELENVLENDYAEESNGSLQNVINAGQDQLPAPVEENVEEPQKHTYAYIVAKKQSAPPLSSQLSGGKNASAASEWNRVSQPSAEQPVVSSNPVETPETEVAKEVPVDDEVEIKSVYVRNLPSTVTEYEIEEEFQKFGQICPDGVSIRSRKDVGVCYAFVEFEDMTSVHNAVQEGVAQVAGRQVYIEGRRPNSNIPFRGRGRGSGRGSYQMDAPRGRFGARSYGRGGSGYDASDRDYNRLRGNGIYRPSARQDRGFSGQQASRTGQDSDY